jgi:hypothetical protein
MKVKQIIIVMLLCFIDVAVLAQEYPLGVRAQALGGATVAKGREAEALFENPALLAEITKLTLTAFYSQPFSIKELRLSSLAGSMSWSGFAFGLAIVDFGTDLYGDRRYHLAMARSVLSTQRLALGASGTLRHLHVSGYGDDSALLLNAGIQLRLSESFTLGSAFTNLLNAEIGQQPERLPQSTCFGLAYAPTATVMLLMDVYKQNRFPEEWRIGIEAKPLSALILRTGIANNPDRLTFGFALKLFKASLQFTMYSHTDLGWTQQYAITLM